MLLSNAEGVGREVHGLIQVFEILLTIGKLSHIFLFGLLGTTYCGCVPHAKRSSTLFLKISRMAFN